MKLTVLVDNYSLIDKYYLAEPALAFYIEDDDSKILFDTGYSDVIISNARKMNIDLNKINTIALSHGHNDHTGGLQYLKNLKQNIDLYCCEKVDEIKIHNDHNITCPIKIKELPDNFKIHMSQHPQKISNHLTFLGEINRSIQPLRKLGDDPLYDDSALVYKDIDNISIITGCSHSGICNIVNQAKTITSINKINTIIGGLHLLNSPSITAEVCDYLKMQTINCIYPCHCTDLYSKIELSKIIPIKEIGVSSVIEL